MRSAFALRINSGRIILIEQCRTACGLSGIAFSQVGSWRKAAFAALVSCGNIRAAGNGLTLSGGGFMLLTGREACTRYRPSPLRPLTAFASTSPKGRGSGETAHFALELETLRGLPRAPPLGELSPQVTERARLLTERARMFAGNTPPVKTRHFALKPETFPPCQGLPPRGSWLCAAKTEGVFLHPSFFPQKLTNPFPKGAICVIL